MPSTIKLKRGTEMTLDGGISTVVWDGENFILKDWTGTLYENYRGDEVLLEDDTGIPYVEVYEKDE